MKQGKATMINMRRRDMNPSGYCEHAGLYLDRGFQRWNDNTHSTDIVQHHKTAAKIKCPPIYQATFANWRQRQLQNTATCAVWYGQLQNRLYIGLGKASPLEAGITLHHVYGVPFIPGSAIKGVLSHYAAAAGIAPGIRHALFGKEASPTDRKDSGEAGYVIFNDAWWVPEGKALAPEIITVHAQQYYSGQGKDAPHPDFESPNPNPQIAVQGSFMFCMEGDKAWVNYTIALLKKALEERGIGGKTSSGYGYFGENKIQQKAWHDELRRIAIDDATPEEKLRLLVNELTLERLPEVLGKKRNVTSREIGEADWPAYLALIREKFSPETSGWNATKANPNQKKAYKTLSGEWKPTWN